MFGYNGIALYKCEEDAVERLLQLKHNTQLSMHRSFVCTVLEQRQWLLALDSDPHAPRQLLLEAEYAGPLGIFFFTHIDYVNRCADVTWGVYPDCRKQGLGKKIVKAGTAYGFKLLNLHRLSAEILVTNVASVKCAEAAGYTREGVKRQAVLKEGAYIDSSVYGVLQTDP